MLRRDLSKGEYVGAPLLLRPHLCSEGGWGFEVVAVEVLGSGGGVDAPAVGGWGGGVVMVGVVAGLRLSADLPSSSSSSSSTSSSSSSSTFVDWVSRGGGVEVEVEGESMDLLGRFDEVSRPSTKPSRKPITLIYFHGGLLEACEPLAFLSFSLRFSLT